MSRQQEYQFRRGSPVFPVFVRVKALARSHCVNKLGGGCLLISDAVTKASVVVDTFLVKCILECFEIYKQMQKNNIKEQTNLGRFKQHGHHTLACADYANVTYA